MTGLEMQVLDNGTDSTVTQMLRFTSIVQNLYDINAAPDGATKLAGEWNQFEIIVENGHLKQILNGVVTVDRTSSTTNGVRILPVLNFMNSWLWDLH